MGHKLFRLNKSIYGLRQAAFCWNKTLIEKYFNYEYQITVVGFGEGLNNYQTESCNKHTIIYIGERKEVNQKSLYILHTTDHYDCIKYIKSFYRCNRSENSFCDICKTPYYIGHHACISNCDHCQRQVCLEGEEKMCEFCFVKCKSIDCSRIHTKKFAEKQKYVMFVIQQKITDMSVLIKNIVLIVKKSSI